MSSRNFPLPMLASPPARPRVASEFSDGSPASPRVFHGVDRVSKSRPRDERDLRPGGAPLREAGWVVAAELRAEHGEYAVAPGDRLQHALDVAHRQAALAVGLGECPGMTTERWAETLRRCIAGEPEMAPFIIGAVIEASAPATVAAPVEPSAPKPKTRPRPPLPAPRPTPGAEAQAVLDGYSRTGRSRP